MKINCSDKIGCEMYSYYKINNPGLSDFEKRFCIIENKGLYSCKALDEYINYNKLNKIVNTCLNVFSLNKLNILTFR